MPSKKQSPNSLSEAIEKLESVGESTAKDFKGILENDFSEIKKAFETLRPHLADIQDNIEKEVTNKKEAAEAKLKENPWLVIAIVGFFAFVLGSFFAQTKKTKVE